MNSNYLFDSLTKSSFLYYAWLELNNSFFFVCQKKYKNLRYKSISLTWFRKASFSLEAGNYSYSYKQIGLFTFSRSKLVCYRNKILENAVYNLVYPFFYYVYFYQNSFLSL